jgi:hypothetical protein
LSDPHFHILPAGPLYGNFLRKLDFTSSRQHNPKGPASPVKRSEKGKISVRGKGQNTNNHPRKIIDPLYCLSISKLPGEFQPWSNFRSHFVLSANLGLPHLALDLTITDFRQNTVSERRGFCRECPASVARLVCGDRSRPKEKSSEQTLQVQTHRSQISQVTQTKTAREETPAPLSQKPQMSETRSSDAPACGVRTGTRRCERLRRNPSPTSFHRTRR